MEERSLFMVMECKFVIGYMLKIMRALYEVVSKGKVGETYNIGSRSEKTNLEVVETICDLLNDLISQKSKTHSHYKSLIKFMSTDQDMI